jgi:hypothetical protein
LAIVTLVVWVLTAAAGLVLLMAGSAARRAAAQQEATGQAVPAPVPPVSVPQVAAPVTQPAAAAPVTQPAAATGRPGAAAGRAEPPPIPRVKVHARPGEHPLLEFFHPVLGLVGMGVWFVYVGTRHAPLAWASFGILVAAITLGLSWLARNRLAARRGERPARAGFPPRLALLHGLTATATFVLAVLTALSASHR